MVGIQVLIISSKGWHTSLNYVFTRLAYKSLLYLHMVDILVSTILLHGWPACLNNYHIFTWLAYKSRIYLHMAGIQVSNISSHGCHTGFNYVFTGWHTGFNYVFKWLAYRSQLCLHMVGIQVSIMSSQVGI